MVLQGAAAAVERRDDDSRPGQTKPNTAQVPRLLTFPLHHHHLPHLHHHHMHVHHQHHHLMPIHISKLYLYFI